MNCILHYNFKEDQIWSISSFNREKLHELIIPYFHYTSLFNREREREREMRDKEIQKPIL
jgi:hypothetical protein